jgi:hypothetical protein
LVTRPVAAIDWYKGIDEFNFKTGAPLAPQIDSRKITYENFANMMWKKTTKVGFGISGKYVIARFCDVEPYKNP